MGGMKIFVWYSDHLNRYVQEEKKENGRDLISCVQTY